MSEEIINQEEKIEEIDEKTPIIFYKNPIYYICIVIIIIMYIFSRKYFITSVIGESMYPTLKSNQMLIVDRNTSNIDRFDIIIIDADVPLIKRVIGEPNDTIKYEDNALYVNGQLQTDKYGVGNTEDFEITLKDNEYFCMGDNRENSRDSRHYGAFTIDKIKGKVIKE
ncbi:MAG: signal peptidase I [Bacilli bacterium]|nr:signal peptidase I [Bacilli bacterium]